MKTKFLTRMFGFVLSAAVAFASVPVSATETAGEAVMESAEQKESSAIETEEVEDIFTFDWKNATVEQINEVVSHADDADLGVWLKSMNKDDYEKLLSMDTYLHSTTEVTDYTVDENGDMTANEGSTKTMEYYEYALSKVPQNNKLTFNKTEGYYSLKFAYNGITYTYKMGISKIKTGVSAAKRQEVTLALTTPNNVPAVLEFSSTSGKADKTRKLQTQVGKEDADNYLWLNCVFSFSKPAGYTVSYTTDKKYAGTEIYYYDSGDYRTKKRKFTGSSNTAAKERMSLVSCVNLRDAGVTMTKGDGTKQDAQKSYFKFTLNPISYSVNYNGNGATGGSVAKQTCSYGTNYYPQTNRFVRNYGITYNANGGSADKQSETVSYTFAGWGFNTASVANYPVNKAFSNLTTTNGGVINAYAIWNPVSTTLPKASRTGYTFAGWKNSADGKVYAAGTSYTPAASSTMTAQWTPNTYTIKFNTNGGNSIANKTYTYDKLSTLPTPTKAGYTFTGWEYNNETYKDSVKNLTAANKATITLKAAWSPKTNTKYTVVHKLQNPEKLTDPSQAEYITKETEEKTGTTGEIVMPATKTYTKENTGTEYDYQTPPAQMKTIAGDGSTVVEYRYNAIIKKDFMYTVEHYLQDGNTGKYVLDSEKTMNAFAVENTTVTPEVVTDYAGYVLPSAQSVVVDKDGTVIKYYYNARTDIPYKVVHELQSGDDPEKYVTYETEEKTGTTGADITPAVKSYAGYDAPETQTVSINGDGSTVVTYSYNARADVPYKVVHKLQSGEDEEKYTEKSVEEYIGVAGETIEPAAIPYAGYITPEIQTVTVNGDGSTVVTYLYKARTNTLYRVMHMLQKEEGSGEYVEKETEEKSGTTGSKVTPPTKTYAGYVSPEPQTVTISGTNGTIVIYEYNIKETEMAAYRVEHWLQDPDDKSAFEMDEEFSGDFEAPAESSVTPEVVTEFEGYDIPNPQTVVVKADGSTLVKYYYMLSDENSSYITGNNGGSTGDVNNFKSGDVKYYKDANGNTYEIFINNDGTLTIRSITPAASSKGTLNISGTLTINGVKYQVTEIAPYAFKNNKKIKTVKIGNGITKIGKGAFKGCTKLQKVTFGTSLSVIESSAFYGCTSLTTVKTNKALTKIGSKAFYNCKKLKSYTIGKYVNEIGSYAFYNCKKLKKITISESVEIIRDKAFYGCKNLKSVSIKSTKLIKVGKAAFKKCKKKINFTVPEKKAKAYKKLLKGKY